MYNLSIPKLDCQLQVEKRGKELIIHTIRGYDVRRSHCDLLVIRWQCHFVLRRSSRSFHRENPRSLQDRFLTMLSALADHGTCEYPDTSAREIRGNSRRKKTKKRVLCVPWRLDTYIWGLAPYWTAIGEKPAPKDWVNQWRERFDRVARFLISSAIG